MSLRCQVGSRIRKPDALWVCVHSRNAGGEHGSRPEGEQLGGQVRSPYRYTDGLQSHPCLQFVHVGTPPCSRNISQLPFPACQSDPSYTGVVCMDIYLTYTPMSLKLNHACTTHTHFLPTQAVEQRKMRCVSHLPVRFITHTLYHPLSTSSSLLS